MVDKINSGEDEKNSCEKDKKVENVKKQGLILRFLSWLAKGSENDSKTSPFCST